MVLKEGLLLEPSSIGAASTIRLTIMALSIGTSSSTVATSPATSFSRASG